MPVAGRRFPHHAAAFELGEELVADCLDTGRAADRSFERVWRQGLASVPVVDRPGGLASTIGDMAEAVAAVALVEVGYEVVGQVGGPGRHGIDRWSSIPAVVVWSRSR